MKHFVPEGYYCAAKDADKRKLFFPFKGLFVDFLHQINRRNGVESVSDLRQWDINSSEKARF
ncbi:hypothetical protein, partial [Brenneria alni]|uniref:hypothetical protein n=1 Tax=Brenneria alni TaxID=71656 RepID=UPI00196A67FB